ncbi:hypothetical protein HA402_014291 [Bradysia odoriphaga]|nr:hypothetical protein HA402_014291 [Bradysia odoriphaga]
MCGVNSYKFSSDQLTAVLELISKTNITLSDLEKAIGLFEKVTDILVQLKLPSSGLCSIEDVDKNSNEHLLQSQIQRLRITSIDFLKCKKFIPKDHNRLKRTRKRKLSETNIETTDSKVIKVRSTSLAVQRYEDAPIGRSLFSLCYICKKNCTTDNPRHEFYQWMCVQCGNFNYSKRNQMADLKDKIALVTGGRIKIGFEIALKLLRCGATVTITTRFPNDARKRYEQQNDYVSWSNRLHIYGLDLRFIPQVDKFCEYFTTHFRQLDILIQNAAQTIRRPTVYYKSLIEGERDLASSLLSNNIRKTKKSQHEESVMEIPANNSMGLFSSAETSQLLIHPEDFKYSCDAQLSQLHFPLDKRDDDGDQLDLRPQNTWTTVLEQVETQEMVEVTLANYMAPFIILKKLKPLMEEGRNSKSDYAFVILVSAMEGKFSDCFKTGNHPHTNAAKAALNMLVRTAAHTYKKQGILMNAVDTGWVTDEHPVGFKSKLVDGVKPPLDSIDGAARVLDPILQTVNDATENPIYGKFLKDYRQVGW